MAKKIYDNSERIDEVREIMSTMPHWLLRWGTFMIAGLLASLIFVAVIVKYPETVDGSVIVTCPTPPAKLIARATGRVDLQHVDGDTIRKGDIIAIIENTASKEEVLALKKDIEKLEEYIKTPYKFVEDQIILNNYYRLGGLEDTYNQFKNHCDTYVLFLSLNKNAKKIHSFHELESILTKEKQVLLNQQKMIGKEVALIQRQVSSDSLLVVKGALSRIEKEQTEERYLTVINKLNMIKENLLKNQEQMTRIHSNSDDLFLTDKSQKIELEWKIKMAYKELKTQIEYWNHQYVLKAPFDGTLSLFDIWNSNQIVNLGDEVAHVITDSDDVFAKLKVTGKRFGKVTKGQDVKITLDSYPTSEYGFLFGKVQKISAINKDNVYVIHVNLNDGLRTTFHQEIPFRHEMVGVGQIYTAKYNVLQRIFYQFKDLFNSTL